MMTSQTWNNLTARIRMIWREGHVPSPYGKGTRYLRNLPRGGGRRAVDLPSLSELLLALTPIEGRGSAVP